jgi:hypothetical protein
LYLLRLAVALAAFASGRDALAHGEGGESEKSLPRRANASAREESANPFRQSAFIFDQSMTTQTASLGPSPQSYVPLYELWLSFRPRYYFDEHWSLRGRFDYTKELTNSQSTTYYREDVFGDIWTDLVYSAKLDGWWRDTQASVGLRALWPTSKVSQAAGTYVKPGVAVGAAHKFQLRGGDAPALNDFHIGLSLSYLHPLTAGTTATSYGGFAYVRQNVDGFSFLSDQITGQTLPEHIFWTILDTGLQITPRLSATADFIAINSWHYPPTSNVHVPIAGGTASVPSASGDIRFTQNLWLLAYIDYALFDELDLSLGYYNLANGVAPSGQTRSIFGSDNIWWSPDARVFFDITANLDILFDDATGHRYSSKQAQATRRERVAEHLR